MGGNPTIVSNAIVLEVLNHDNYKDWSSRVETYLVAEDLWDVIRPKTPDPEIGESDEYKDWKMKNAKALHAIKISCGSEIFSLIREISTAKMAWEKLERKFKTIERLRLERKCMLQKVDECAGNESSSENYRFDPSYKPFFDHVVNGDWDKAKGCLANLHINGALTAKLPENGCAALHLAARKGHVHVAKELVSLMVSSEDLEARGKDGQTALHEAAHIGNWHIVKELVSSMRPEGLGIRDKDDATALHKAVSSGHVSIVEELASKMREEDLVTKDAKGFTALIGCVLASHDEGDLTQMARFVVKHNRDVLGIPHKFQIPVVKACAWNKWEMARYLYSVTPPESLFPDNGNQQGAKLITICLRRQQGLDIALDLLRNCPRLATTDDGFGGHPMLVLAGMRHAFLSGARLTLWQKWIYQSIHVQPLDTNFHNISIGVPKSEDDEGHRRDLRQGLRKLLGVDHICEMKSTHTRVAEFVKCMSEMTRNMGDATLEEEEVVTNSIFKAIEQGHNEFVTQMCKENPKLVDVLDDKRRNIFQYAIECRQEKVYNLLYGLEKGKKEQFGFYIARFNNNILHSAANLSPLGPLTRFDHIQGASLQMQRELQWFKEVEKVLPPEMHEYVNSSDGLTPRKLFTKNHKKLKNEAEISMKGTATSCTTVGALIVTMMFAAAFTVPGGTNGDTGFPMFRHKQLFEIFIVSDTISLVSSATSVITFLGLLTARYAEDDFLKSLPTKMVIGLSTLFISIVSMMIAFICSLVIMLDGEAKIVIPSILCASVPVISFVWLLFPLLVEICKSTYGPGIFARKVQPWFDSPKIYYS